MNLDTTTRARNYAKALGRLEGAARSAVRYLESGNPTEARRALLQGMSDVDDIAGPSGALSTPPRLDELLEMESPRAQKVVAENDAAVASRLAVHRRSRA